MRFGHNPEPFVQVGQTLDANGFSHQARHAVSPFVVQAFDHAGLAASLITRPVLPGLEEGAIGVVKVGINQFAAILGGHLKPHLLQRFLASVAHTPRQHLMRQSRNHQPQIPVAPLESIAYHQLINLQSIARNSGQNRPGKTQAAGARLFLSTRRTVSRPALRLRAMARCDKRSCKAFSINASFSALMRRPSH